MNLAKRIALALLLCLALPAVTGCELLASVDRSEIPGRSGGVGGDGAGGGQSGAGGQGGQGGQGGAPVAVCGDGVVASPAEACDDGNATPGDGCDAACATEQGYACVGAPSVCAPVCGDGVRVGAEECDDGDVAPGDGCSAACVIEQGYACAGAPSVCTAGCGDGDKGGSEACDDGNDQDGDCCSHACQVEAGCEIEPNDTSAEANDALGIAVAGHIKAFIDPSDDVDFFSLSVPDGATGTLTIETLDGFAGSTCADLTVDTRVTVLDGALTVIDSNDDISADDYCSFLSVKGLKPGSYFIEVSISPYATPASFDYVMSVALDISVCGDRVKNGIELCDDGNTVDGDGCSATCVLDKPTPEKEPNNTTSDADANGELTPNVLIAGAITPIGDKDVYAIKVPGYADLRIETFDPGSLTTCDQGVDTDVFLIDIDGSTVLAEDDDAGLAACSLISSETTFGAARLPPGTYYVRVEEFTNDALIPGYSLLVTFDALCGDGVVEGAEECDGGASCDAECNRVPVCGDGYIDAPEACDDGNTTSGDGCSAACALEGVVAEIEPNDTAADAAANGPRKPDVLFAASIDPGGDVDYFAVNVPAVSDLEIETFDATGPSQCDGVDTVIQLYAPDGTTLLAEDDESGVKSCSKLDSGVVIHMQPGVYYVRVEDYFGGTIPAYTLRVIATALCGDGVVEGAEECDGGAGCDPSCDRIPICGDAFIDAPEVCDDGNTASGDGCSAACQLEGVTNEIEPNETTAEADANGALASGALVAGSIAAASDVDVFAVTLPSVSDLRLETFGVNGPGTCAGGVDTVLDLIAPDGATVLASDNDSGVAGCSRIDPSDPAVKAARHLPAGTYYVRVQSFNNETVIGGYTLSIKITAACGDGVKEGSEECDGGATCDASCDRIPTCGDAFVDYPEGCDDGNATAGDGCSAACQLEGPSPEVEPNDTLPQAAANALVLNGSGRALGSIAAAGDHDLVRLAIAADAVVRLEVFDGTGAGCDGGMSTTLRVLTKVGAPVSTDAGLTEAEYASGAGSCSALVLNLLAGEYYVAVEERGDDAPIPAYVLEVKVQADGGSEVEVNDTQAEANPIAGSDVFVLGGHMDSYESDFFAINVKAGQSVRAEIIEGGSETCESEEVDSRLTLFNAKGDPLANDDDGGRGLCSILDGTGSSPRDEGAHGLAAGTYFLRVRASTYALPTGSMFDYRLAVTIR